LLFDRTGRLVYTLDGASLVALVDAENRIAEAYGLKPTLLISSDPGLNTAGLEVNGRSLVIVNADTVKILGCDRELWGAISGHEFGHPYHHHSAVSQTLVALIRATARFLDSEQRADGRIVHDAALGHTREFRTVSR
jgi:Zn-dependent protease with chaperone function